MSTTEDSLTLAVEALSWLELKGIDAFKALGVTANQLEIRDPATISQAYTIITETLRRRNVLDRLVESLLPQELLEELSLGVKSFLRILAYKTRFAEGGGVEEGARLIALARRVLGWRTLHPVEPLLGRILTYNLDGLYGGAGEYEAQGLRLYQPSWFVRYAYKVWGRRRGLEILRGLAETPPRYITLNPSKGGEKVKGLLTGEGVKVEDVEGAKGLFKVGASPLPLPRTQTYRRGGFIIQDLSSFTAVEAAAPSSGQIVVDLCSAPGIKASALALRVGGGGRVLCVELSLRRMGMVGKEARRLGLKNLHTIVADASDLPLKGGADMVMVDSPSTGTGLFGGEPSLKWRWLPGDVKKFQGLQRKILEEGAGAVRVGGTLVYTTNSLMVEENEEVVSGFLATHPDFALVRLEGVGEGGLRGLEGARRLYPHLHHCHGAFIAKLKKLP